MPEENGPEFRARVHVLNMFFDRNIRRERGVYPEVPSFDFDIIEYAGAIGLSEQEIDNLSKIARREVGRQKGIELLEIDEKILARAKPRKRNLN